MLTARSVSAGTSIVAASLTTSAPGGIVIARLPPNVSAWSVPDCSRAPLRSTATSTRPTFNG